MFKKIFLIGIFAAVILAVYGFWAEPNTLEISRYKFESSELSDVRVVFAADFHLAPDDENRLERIVGAINAQNPDIVILGGDYVNGHRKQTAMPAGRIAESLGRIKSKYGIYAVLGNHDIWYGKDDIMQAFFQNHITVLDNRNQVLEISGHRLYLAGVADPVTEEPDIRKALEGTTSPVIFVTHSPDIFPEVPQNTLTLAGHTHGGQIVLPWWGAPVSNSKFGQRYLQGKIVEDGKTLIVSKGLGTSILPVRFLCRPEIVVVDF